MVPRISSPGRSFQGAGLYYLHDKDAMTSERVAFTQVENVAGVQDPEKALGWMAYTALSAEQLKHEAGGRGTGRKAEKPVWTMSFAWQPEQQPSRDDMVAAGRAWLKERGLAEHQAVMVAHSDQPHAHLHVIVNLIHPATGRLNKQAVSYSHLKASRWAQAFEQASGKIYCPQRVENNARRDKGEFVRYRDPELDLAAQITKLYHAADSGKALVAALAEQDYSLARGNKIVLIDKLDGTVHSLTRQIEGVKEKDIRAKLADVKLPDIDEGRGKQGRQGAGDRKTGAERTPEAEPVGDDRDAQDRAWQEALIDAAIQHGRGTSARPASPAPAQRIEYSFTDRINAMQDRHHAELGELYRQNQRDRNQMAETFETEYGQRERQLRQDIARLEKRQKTTGKVQRLVAKLTGRQARAAEELDGLRRSLENIEWRKDEVRLGLDSQIKARWEGSATRQAGERQELEQQREPQPGDLQRAFDPVADLLRHERQNIEQHERTQERDPGGPTLDF